jgi:hypothetical protein
MEDIKRKSLQFFDFASETLFAFAVYFLLLTHSFIEFFEQTRFGRDTISLYKKNVLQHSHFQRTIQEIKYFHHKIHQNYQLFHTPRKKISCVFDKVMVKYYYLIQDRYYGNH